MLPNFIHVGAAKCASSWLWRVYQEHPDVYVPLHLDNVNFFVADYHKGLDWYQETYFDDWCGGEGSGRDEQFLYGIRTCNCANRPGSFRREVDRNGAQPD